MGKCEQPMVLDCIVMFYKEAYDVDLTIGHPRLHPMHRAFASRKSADSAGGLAPTHQVLVTTELLEAILLHLPLKDLLFSQEVCRHWKAVAEQSPSIKKALFLVPDTQPDLVMPTTNPTPYPFAINSLLLACVQPGRDFYDTSDRYAECCVIRSAALQAIPAASCRKMHLSRPAVDTELYFTAEVTDFVDLISFSMAERHEMILKRGQKFEDLVWLYNTKLLELKQREYEAASDVKIGGALLQYFQAHNNKLIQADMTERWLRGED
ncbi:hypothetical protein LTR56_016184 [Elasticomyces elasticus]|nr:hypothetical protein LTR56_016184 [Elasticomyces elasticus]KAK3642143.1 hypothetical protein LTR22_016264 [Elasticomyces elasticus]KAK4914191.1 hypothetical protein LTR49_017544 [Elasticomyces elasticus]KAK5762552.1 hypothetical protein LTS12_007343 [Elasticomyces elasticus]